MLIQSRLSCKIGADFASLLQMKKHLLKKKKNHVYEIIKETFD